jgi:hypothetical protein
MVVPCRKSRRDVGKWSTILPSGRGVNNPCLTIYEDDLRASMKGMVGLRFNIAWYDAH